MTVDPLRVLMVGAQPGAEEPTAGTRPWPALVAALADRGDAVLILTTDGPGSAGVDRARPRLSVSATIGVDRSLRGYWSPGGWRQPGRLEASRLGRHGLLRLGQALRVHAPHVVVWTAVGGLPLTLIGASGLPELALVHDDWPVYGAQVDPQTRREGWDPGAVAMWSCDSPARRDTVLTALAGRVDAATVAVDDPSDADVWAQAILARLDALTP